MKILVLWEAPVANPNDDGIYTWNEHNTKLGTNIIIFNVRSYKTSKKTKI
jgi:hypothetical protein